MYICIQYNTIVRLAKQFMYSGNLSQKVHFSVGQWCTYNDVPLYTLNAIINQKFHFKIKTDILTKTILYLHK